MQTKNQSMECRSLVIKVASRCNLNCTYCYMYNMGDDSFIHQPKLMSKETAEALIRKTAEHCREHNVREFFFGFHGGEPLLQSPDFYRFFVNRANEVLLPDTVPVFLLQTNATLLDTNWCDLLGELNIHVSVSLDGLPDDNDKHRIDHAGRGTYNRIIRGWNTIKLSPSTNYTAPLLCVININADPVRTYNHFKACKARCIDFLLPDSTYDQPPPKPGPESLFGGETPYADWLISLFDRWFDDSEPRLKIRFFESIISSVFGNELPVDSLGLSTNNLLVIETNGDIEAVDVLKICGEGFTKNSSSVYWTSFAEAMQTPLANLYYDSSKFLCKQCSSCPVNDVCGGGYLPHRYSKYSGFNNPSVYCQDLLKLITHIQNKLFDQLPAQLLEEGGVRKLGYEEARQMLLQSATNEEEPEYLDELLKF